MTRSGDSAMHVCLFILAILYILSIAKLCGNRAARRALPLRKANTAALLVCNARGSWKSRDKHFHGIADELLGGGQWLTGKFHSIGPKPTPALA